MTSFTATWILGDQGQFKIHIMLDSWRVAGKHIVRRINLNITFRRLFVHIYY